MDQLLTNVCLKYENVVWEVLGAVPDSKEGIELRGRYSFEAKISEANNLRQTDSTGDFSVNIFIFAMVIA